MLLWIIFAASMAAVITIVLWPILYARRDVSARVAYDTAIYRDQLDEIEADLSRGLIGNAEAEAAKAEVSRRLLAAAENSVGADTSGDTSAAKNAASTLAVVFAGFVVPALCVTLYLEFGSPEMRDRPLAARMNQPEGSQEIVALIKKVEAQLREHPEDGNGWDVIAPVYLKQRRFNDAADAYGRALRLLGESTNRLIGRAEALVFANDGVVSEEARLAFKSALTRDASQPKAQFWLAMAEEQDGRFDEAAKVLRGMLAQGPADAPWRPMVEQRLQLVERKNGGTQQTEARPAPAGEPGPSQEQVAAARQMSAGDRAAMINQMVEGLAQRLKQDGKDLQGWLRLVRAYTVLGEREKAADALGSARKNFHDDGEALKKLSALAENLGL